MHNAGIQFVPDMDEGTLYNDAFRELDYALVSLLVRQ